MYNEELYHYGVKGMRWGHRKKYYNEDGSLNKVGQARQTYKNAKKEFASARINEFRTTINPIKTFGVEGIKRTEKVQKRTNKAYADMVTANARYKASKAKTAEKAEKAEFKTYKNAMMTTGLRGSANDTSSGGRSTAIYNEMKIKKGKAYADRVEKRMEKELVAGLAASAIATGAVIVGSLLENS